MKTMNVRKFLRGEYKDSTEPILVMSYSKPVGIWNPISTETVTSSQVLDNMWDTEPTWTLTLAKDDG